MGKKKTTEEFIQRAREVHGDKYDYSRVEYVNAKTKVCIICPEHGVFWQISDSHLRGYGCFRCGRVIAGEKQKQWTYDNCYKTALKYKQIYNFRIENPVAYAVASKRCWLKDYVWLVSDKKPNGYWGDFEHCKEAAKKCYSASEFQKRYSAAYSHSVKNGWIAEFFPKRQKKVHWTDELALEEAKKYLTKTEFKEANEGAWKYICDNNLMECCTWFVRKPQDNHKLVQEYIDNAAKKYNGFYDYSKIDIYKVNQVSHTKVDIVCPEHGVFQQNLYRHLNDVCPCPKCRRGIYKKQTNLIQTIIKDEITHGIIYCYTNKLNDKKYVGQTIDFEKRKKAHLRKNQKNKTLFDKILQDRGEKNFTLEVLFEVDAPRSQIRKILNEQEKHYIKLFNCRVPNGYNVDGGGNCMDFMTGYKPTEKTRQKLRESHKGIASPMKGKHYSKDKKDKIVSKWKKTMQEKYDNGYVRQRKDIMLFKNGIHIGTYPNAKEIERLFGVDYKRIHYALKRKCPLDDEYIFIYKADYNEELLNEISNKTSIQKQHKKEDKIVKQLDIQGNLIATLKLSEATRQFGHHVSDVCNGSRKSCKGYKFEWAS